MNVCRKCRSHRIKTRTNVSYGRSRSVAVQCKDCGSTDVTDYDETRYRGRR